MSKRTHSDAKGIVSDHVLSRLMVAQIGTLAKELGMDYLAIHDLAVGYEILQERDFDKRSKLLRSMAFARCCDHRWTLDLKKGCKPDLSNGFELLLSMALPVLAGREGIEEGLAPRLDARMREAREEVATMVDLAIKRGDSGYLRKIADALDVVRLHKDCSPIYSSLLHFKMSWMKEGETYSASFLRRFIAAWHRMVSVTPIGSYEHDLKAIRAAAKALKIPLADTRGRPKKN